MGFTVVRRENENSVSVVNEKKVYEGSHGNQVDNQT